MADIKQVFKISGMHCSSCAMSIDGDLEDTKGVNESRTNYAKEECVVEFDDKLINPKKIVEIVRETGYVAVPISQN